MKLRELYETIDLFENYNGKVEKLKKLPLFTENPKLLQDFDARINWAKQVFGDKNQPMLWYISLYEAWVLQQQDPNAATKFNTMLGDLNSIVDSNGTPFKFNFTSFQSFEKVLDHWVASAYAERNQIKDVVKKINAQTTTVAALITNLLVAEEVIKKEDEAKIKNATPVDILPGDQVVLPLGNQGDWWLLPTRRHDPESKFMGHCGTAAHGGNVLLSLRDKTPVPYVTIEYNKNQGMLYQMKGRNNSKPAKKFHHALLTLLKSDLVSSLYTGHTYQASTDFSIFDMDEPLVLDITQTKPTLITDQIKKYPIDFLRAPQPIRANPEFRNYAIQNLAGLSVLVDEAGTINQSLEVWEEAIKKSKTMILYAPETLNDWQNRITDYLKRNSGDLGYASTRTRSNYEIMTEVIKVRATAIEMVPHRAPRYKELAIQAINLYPRLIKSVNTNGWSNEEKKQAWNAAAADYIGTEDWPTNLFTPAENKDIWRHVVIKLPDKLMSNNFPTDLFTNDELKDIWLEAIKNKPDAIFTNAFNDTNVLSDEEKHNLRISAVKQKPTMIIDLSDYITDPELSIDLWLKAIKIEPELTNDYRFPTAALGPKEEKELWIARANAKFSRIDFNKIPTELFTPKEVKQMWMSHLKLNTPNLFAGIIKAPDFIDQDIVKELCLYHVYNDSWDIIYEDLPEVLNNPQGVLSAWSAALGIPGGDFTQDMIDKFGDTNTSSMDIVYVICNGSFPWEVFDDNTKQKIKQMLVDHIDQDSAENAHCLGYANYRELEKLFTPEELYELHVVAVTHGNAYEEGGVLASIPRYYRNFELCKTAIDKQPNNIYAVPKELMSEQQYNELLQLAQEGGMDNDDDFANIVNTRDNDDAANPNRCDPALLQH